MYSLTKQTPAVTYLFKVNNRNTRKMCAICSKLTINKSERRQWPFAEVFIVIFELRLHIVLVFPLLTLNKLMPAWSLRYSWKRELAWNIQRGVTGFLMIVKVKKVGKVEGVVVEGFFGVETAQNTSINK